MKTEGEVEQLYSDVLAKRLDEMEDLRQSSLRKYSLFIWCIPIFIIGLGIFIGVEKPEDFIVPTIFFAPIIFFVFLFISISIKSNYRNTFKNEIIGEMVRFYDNRLIYSPDKGI